MYTMFIRELVQQHLRNTFTGQNKSFDPVQIGFVWENQQFSGLQRYILESQINKNQQGNVQQLVHVTFIRYYIHYLL